MNGISLAGAGLAALARYRTDSEAGLVRLCPDRPVLVREIWIGVHADMRHTPRVRAVTDAVVEALRKNSAILKPSR
jgi:DNA-binding transcriptional LysR family regulator